MQNQFPHYNSPNQVSQLQACVKQQETTINSLRLVNRQLKERLTVANQTILTLMTRVEALGKKLDEKEASRKNMAALVFKAVRLPLVEVKPKGKHFGSTGFQRPNPSAMSITKEKVFGVHLK